MPTAWGICPMRVAGTPPEQYRYCAIEDFRAQITADGGDAHYAEILGDHAVVKVRASTATLLSIDATPGFVRIPRHVGLDEPLSDLTANEKTVLQNKLLSLGYTAGQLQNALGGDLGTKTLRDLLRFAASRWRRPKRIVADVTEFETTDWPSNPRPVEEVAQAVT